MKKTVFILGVLALISCTTDNVPTTKETSQPIETSKNLTEKIVKDKNGSILYVEQYDYLNGKLQKYSRTEKDIKYNESAVYSYNGNKVTILRYDENNELLYTEQETYN